MVDSKIDAHGPRKVVIFAGDELEKVRKTSETFDQSDIVESGPLVCPAFVAKIGALAGLSLRESTCQVFSGPTVGVKHHVDLDYMLREVVDAGTCTSCGTLMTEKQSLIQRGLHWTKDCKKPPSKPKLFTICINLSRTRMEVLGFGGACSIAHNHVRAIVPVIPRVRPGKGQEKMLLDPGEGVVFSAWVVHWSHASSLLGDRISLCYRGFSAGLCRTHTLIVFACGGMPDIHPVCEKIQDHRGKHRTFDPQTYVVGPL